MSLRESHARLRRPDDLRIGDIRTPEIAVRDSSARDERAEVHYRDLSRRLALRLTFLLLYGDEIASSSRRDSSQWQFEILKCHCEARREYPGCKGN